MGPNWDGRAHGVGRKSPDGRRTRDRDAGEHCERGRVGFPGNLSPSLEREQAERPKEGAEEVERRGNLLRRHCLAMGLSRQGRERRRGEPKRMSLILSRSQEGRLGRTGLAIGVNEASAQGGEDWPGLTLAPSLHSVHRCPRRRRSGEGRPAIMAGEGRISEGKKAAGGVIWLSRPRCSPSSDPHQAGCDCPVAVCRQTGSLFLGA